MDVRPRGDGNLAFDDTLNSQNGGVVSQLHVKRVTGIGGVFF